jgi:hypothetical protein
VGVPNKDQLIIVRLKQEIASLTKEVAYLRNLEENRYAKERELRDRFKELLIDTLER